MAATAGKVMSFDGKAYYNAGTYGSPTWTLIPNMGEVKATDSMDWVEVMLRANGGFKGGVPGFQEVSFAWKMLYNLSDTGQAALRTSYRARTYREFLFLDQAVANSGAVGVRGTYYLIKFPREEDDGKPMMVDVEVKPAADAPNKPEYFE